MPDTERKISDKELAGCIDHTLLSATATKEQIERLCREAETYGVARGVSSKALPQSDLRICPTATPNCAAGLGSRAAHRGRRAAAGGPYCRVYQAGERRLAAGQRRVSSGGAPEQAEGAVIVAHDVVGGS